MDSNADRLIVKVLRIMTNILFLFYFKKFDKEMMSCDVEGCHNPPKMFCYVLECNVCDDHSNILNNSRIRNENNAGFVYILLLESNKFYVGYSERAVGERFREHFSNCGSMWTKKYPPVQVLEYLPGHTLADEDRITLELMKKYGWWNVRGGKWCRVNMTKCPSELLERMQLSLPNTIPHGANHTGYITQNTSVTHTSTLPSYAIGSCFRCGRTSHYAYDCYTDITITGERITDDEDDDDDDDIDDLVTCYKCGQPRHYANSCNSPLNREQSSYNGSNRVNTSIASDSSTTSTITRYSTQYERSVTCYRCNRPGHYADECYATSIIQPAQPSFSRSTGAVVASGNITSTGDGPVCYRCNRPGHYSNNCYASSILPRSIPGNTTYTSNSNSLSTAINRAYASSERTVTCHTCGRTGHYANTCYVTSHVNNSHTNYTHNNYNSSSSSGARYGNRIIHGDPFSTPFRTSGRQWSDDREQGPTCYRCGREGHYSNTCYAR